jgi:hypothetical protein
VCPLTLEKIEQKLLSPIEGWEARQTYSKHILNGIGISFGDPKLSDAAIYDDVKTSRTKSGDELEVLVWDLNDVNDPYITCTYSSTNIHLIRSLKGLSKCEVKSVKKRGFNRYEIESAKCF